MVELLLRIGFSLLVVLGLMWLLAKVARRPLAKRGAGGGLTVLSRAQLTRGAGVAVVQVDGRALILGVTEHQVSLLGEAGAPEAHAAQADAAAIHAAQARAAETHATQSHAAEAGPAEAWRPVDEPVPAVSGRAAPGSLPARGGLSGSLLSPRMWAQTVEFLRERTVRR